MPTWFIEDAGGGCRAFSEVLVLVCEDPYTVHSARLPLHWDEELSTEQLACQLVQGMMTAAHVSTLDRILICSGNIFHGVHQWLQSEGFDWDYHKMDGIAHQLAEDLFHQQVLDAGFPPFIRPTDGNYRLYYSFVERWINQDPDRTVYLKNMSCRAKPRELRYVLTANGKRRQLCHQCKQAIPPFTPLVEYHYKHGGNRRRIYFHPTCSPVPPGKQKLRTRLIGFEGEILEAVVRPIRSDGLSCSLCGLPLDPDSDGLHWYTAKQLYHAHPQCFTDS